MKQAKSILIISHHKVLQETRTHILRHAGHQVYPARDYREAMLQLQDPAPLDLVLICHSVPPADLHHLVDRIRVLRPALPILLFCNGFHSHEVVVDGYLQSLDSPDMILELVGNVTRAETLRLSRSA